MRLDVSGVDHLDLGRSAAVSEHAKEPLPNTAFRPADKPVVDGRVRSIFRRAIAPPTPGLDNMHDAADHTTVINTRFAAHIRGQKRPDAFPLLVTQPKQVASHHMSPNHFADSESATDSAHNDFIGFGP